MSVKNKKILTIVIPAYNVAHYLEKTLDSLVGCKHVALLDIIIINDGSTDCTEEIAKSYTASHSGSVRYISKENGGHGSGINVGIKEAKGLYFKILDSDDILSRYGLHHLLDVIKKQNEK